MIRYPRTADLDLPPLPSDDAFLGALQVATRGRYEYGVSASAVAWELGVDGARRLGNGAMKGSWSGRMSGALRVAPRLRSLEKRGLVESYWADGRRLYGLTAAGIERANAG